MPGPLTGYKVVDLSEGDGAPYCGMQLGDAGADVIKVEPIEGDWSRHLHGPSDHGDGPLFMGMNRNKRSIAIDLEKEQGREVLGRLLKRADVFLESIPTESEIKRMGLTYDELSALNPGLVYCDVSYFGRTGPYANKPATDLTVQGIGGLTRFTGTRGQEPISFGENYTGIVAAMYAGIAVSAALFWRLKSGLGQKIETSNLRTIIATQNNYITSSSDPDEVGAQGGRRMRNDVPSRGYKTKDGRVLFGYGYAPMEDPWSAFCKAFNVPEEIHTKYTYDQIRNMGNRNVPELTRIYEDAFKDMSNEQVFNILDGLGLQCAYVHDFDSLFTDEGVLQQQMLVEVDHPTRGKVKTTGVTWKFTETPGSIRLAPPTLGEHTDEILRELGYNEPEIDALHSLKVVK